jgi:DNA-binding transcriptional LysR family regulator
MRFESLNEFLTLVKRRSFTKAAGELYISQSSLSAHISALEKDLGFDLIDHSASSLSLTAAGGEFLGYAQKLLTLYAEAQEQCANRARELPPLRIQAMAASSEVCQALMRFEGCSFVFVDLDFETSALDALEKGVIDLGICSGYAYLPTLMEQVESKGITFVEAGYGEMSLCMARSHPLAARDQLTRKDLKGQTVVINSGAHFDDWRQVVTHLLGEDLDLEFCMIPANSRSNFALADFGTMIHVCGSQLLQESFAHRDDVVIFDTLDGERLLCAEGMAYLASNAQAGRLAEALAAECRGASAATA